MNNCYYDTYFYPNLLSQVYSETGWWDAGEPSRTDDCIFFNNSYDFHFHDGRCHYDSSVICEGSIS